MNDVQTWCFKSSVDGGWWIGPSTKGIHAIDDWISALTRRHKNYCEMNGLTSKIDFIIVSDTELFEITPGRYNEVVHWMYRLPA